MKCVNSCEKGNYYVKMSKLLIRYMSTLLIIKQLKNG